MDKTTLPQHHHTRRILLLIILSFTLTVLGVVLCNACLLRLQGPDPEDATGAILRSVAKGDRRYVIVDEISHGNVPRRIAISQSAWDVLVPHSAELLSATVTITTTGNDMDVVSSDIRIVCPNSTIGCKSDNGQMITQYFYVYTCTVFSEAIQ
ncbi:MAG: hypothetical protein JXA21_14320 [Anaerolineae bacterium]|nr:hypothetical protein [Anaerolineae bacterium]